MLPVLALICAAVFLLGMHSLSRGAPGGRSLTASEAFVVGHWPFFFLNGLIVVLTGGKDWGSVTAISAAPFAVAAALSGAGLLAFLGGGVVAESYHGGSPRGVAVIPDSGTAMILAGTVMTVLGAYAHWTNQALLIELGREERVNALLTVGHLSVPGILLCFGGVLDRRLGWMLRLMALAVALLGMVSLTWAWTRRPLLTVFAGMVLLPLFLRSGTLSRRRLFSAVPFLAVLAVLAAVYRVVVSYGVDLHVLLNAGLVEWYLDKLWLESSAYSAMAWYIHEFGVWRAEGPGPLVAPLLFWLPRVLLPNKPGGFELGALTGEDITIPIGIHGEVIYSLSVFGLLPFLALLGYLTKLVDVRVFAAKAPPAAVRVLYFMFVFDMVFVPRGSFNVMVIPILVHCVLPIGLLWGTDLALRALARPRRRPAGAAVLDAPQATP